MVKIVPTPDWFLGKDILIEAFSFIVLIVFCVLAVRAYKLKKNKGLVYLGLGFGMIALAQIASILTKTILYYDSAPVQALGNAIISSKILNSVDIFYYTGFFFQRFLTLLGLFTIYRLPQKKVISGDYLLIVYFVLLSALLSQKLFYLFHVTAFILLVLIVVNYSMIYRKNGFANTKILIVAFSILAAGQLVYLLSRVSVFFAVGSLAELVSYTLLLVLMIRILKHGEKKRSHGDNIRHVGNNPRKRR
ncbi:MAG: hypothetical protein KKB29_00915 [Nanoarchaeota archaeon]|nr:hypothetical protein [Nanoarchaeota archaeon]